MLKEVLSSQVTGCPQAQVDHLLLELALDCKKEVSLFVWLVFTYWLNGPCPPHGLAVEISMNHCRAVAAARWADVSTQFIEGRDSRTHFVEAGRVSPPAGITGDFEQSVYVPARTGALGMVYWIWSSFRWNQLNFFTWTCTHLARQGRHEWWISRRHGIWRIKKRKDFLSVDQQNLRPRNIRAYLQT